ncbi:MAG: BlaI/MecI/CopY family transcriptional regulator [Planctomycetota bacterium]
MARKPKPGLTERESEIMEVLWESGPATSEDVRSRLSGNPHDSSVRTFLRILIDKGMVKADSKKRPAVYRAAVRKDKVQKKEVGHLLKRMFGGSAESLVLRLIEDEQLTLDQLEEIRSSIKKRKGS